jgi:hypothetical protein
MPRNKRVLLDWQIAIALEEMELEYDVHVIDIGKNDQFTPEFIAINPNSKIPAIVDPDGPGEPPDNYRQSLWPYSFSLHYLLCEWLFSTFLFHTIQILIHFCWDYVGRWETTHCL